MRMLVRLLRTVTVAAASPHARHLHSPASPRDTSERRRGGGWSERPQHRTPAPPPRHQQPWTTHRSRHRSGEQQQQQQQREASLVPVEGQRSVAAPDARTAFWSQSATHMQVAALKRQHATHCATDKLSRFEVRSRIRDDGVFSNLYPITFSAGETYLYVYEVYVTRQTSPQRPSSSAGAAAAPRRPAARAPAEQRVQPGRAWRAVERFIRHRYAGGAAAMMLPPLVQVANKVYAAAPLPVDVLKLPSAYHDVGWKVAELRLQHRCRYTEVPPSELQMLLNKIVPAVVRAAHRESGPSSLEVVREKSGKIICTTTGVSVGGLRVYRGVLVQAIFVDATAAATPTSSATAAAPAGARTSRGGGDADACPVTTRHLGDSPVGLTDAAAPTQLQVVAYLRAFSYRGTPAESYRVRDASGVYLASLWSPAQPRSLVVGAVYTAAPVRIREFAERGNARLIEFIASTVITLVSPPPTPSDEGGRDGGGDAVSAVGAPLGSLPGQLSLKIDTKGTLAVEASLWEEVWRHFGSGPYDAATQQRIRTSVKGIPVVLSYSLRQSVVCDVRFDGLAAHTTPSVATHTAGTEDGNGNGNGNGGGDGVTDSSSRSSAAAGQSIAVVREPRLLPLLPLLDAQQPSAVLTDHTIVPLQVLHCCYDPRMRGWQEIGAAALSAMPQQRAELLQRVQASLVTGLRRWGIELAAEPLRTTTLSILPTPVKSVAPARRLTTAAGTSTSTTTTTSAAASLVRFPTTVVVIGVAGPRCTAEQTRRIGLTAQHLGHYLKTNIVATVVDESAAVQYVHERLMHTTGAPSTVRVKDPNASVVLVTTEVDTRATRWFKVECMCRGVHCIAVPASINPRGMNLAGAQLRQRVARQFEQDPLRGVDLRREVPVLGGRHILVIGVDACHTNAISVGSIVGILSTPAQNRLLSHFWRQDARGREAQHVAKHFRGLLARAAALSGRLDEVVVFQDGDVFSELVGMRAELTAQMPNCGLTFMCLHKRCNVRFMHASTNNAAAAGGAGGADNSGAGGAFVFHNSVKSVVVPALTPVPLDHQLAAPSFFLQAHESAVSTARTVHYTVHHTSPTLDVADVQHMANVMANVLAPQPTKLPMSTRCAHRLADQAERLLDAVPPLSADMIPPPLCHRLWFM